MDDDSPLVNRLERTFWTVWYYISGAVNRFLRPEPENSVSNNPDSLQESTADSELEKCHHEDGASGGEVQGEQTLATASPLNSSRPAVAWDLCTSEIELGPDEKCTEHTAELKDSTRDEDTREEELIQTGNEETQLLVAKNNKDGEEDGDIAGTVEEDTERTETPDLQDVEDIPVKVQNQEDDVPNFETGSIEINLSTITDLCPKEEVTMHKEEATGHGNFAEAETTENMFLLVSGNENKSDEDALKDDSELLTASNTSVPVSEDEAIVAGLEYALDPRESKDESGIEDEKMESLIESEEQKVVIEDEVPEHIDEIQTVTGDSKEEVNSTAQIWCSDDVLLNAETELHMEKGLKDVAKDISEQIKRTEMDDGETQIYGAATNEKSVVKSSNAFEDEHLFDKNQTQEDSKESDVERVTKQEGDTGQEVSWEFGNAKPPTCKEAQGGVPEYINEPEPDENATQRFQELEDSNEVQSTPLPEEMENQELESLQNSGDNTETDYLAGRDQTETGQESKEGNESYLDLVPSLVQEAGPLPVEENREVLVSSVVDYSEKESDFSVTSEKELDREEGILVEIDEEPCDLNEADDDQDRFMETDKLDEEETVGLIEAGEPMVKTSLQDSVDALGPKEKSTATEFLEQSLVTELQALTEAEQQFAVTDLEKANIEVVQNADEVVVEGPELGPAERPETEFSNEKQTKNDEEQLVESVSGESESVSDTEKSLSTAESGFSDQSPSDWGTQNSESHLLKSFSTESIQDMFGNVSESARIPQSSPQQFDSGCQDTLMMGTDEADKSHLKDDESVTGFCLDSAVVKNLNQESEETEDNTDEEPGSQEEINAEEQGLVAKTDLKTTEEENVELLAEVSTLFQVQKTKTEIEAVVMSLSDSEDESKQTESACTRNSLEGILSTESSLHDNTSMESEKGSMKLPSEDKLKHECLEDILDIQKRAEVENQLSAKSELQSQVDGSALDFTAQRSRIAVKNPHVRPPKDPRSLILMSSLDPTPDPHVPAKLPLGGLGIGIKLPGLGAGFPVLKKTQQIRKDETRPESNPQETETKSEETRDTPQQDETQPKRKWMPPRQPGFGNPLMSELKTRLNKTAKD